jgi:hypothetical protein
MQERRELASQQGPLCRAELLQSVCKRLSLDHWINDVCEVRLRTGARIRNHARHREARALTSQQQIGLLRHDRCTPRRIEANDEALAPLGVDDAFEGHHAAIDAASSTNAGVAGAMRANALPIVLTRVGLERPEVAGTVEAFVATAGAAGADLTIVDVPHGQHGFDVLDHTDESRRAVDRAVALVLDRCAQ